MESDIRKMYALENLSAHLRETRLPSGADRVHWAPYLKPTDTRFSIDSRYAERTGHVVEVGDVICFTGPNDLLISWVVTEINAITHTAYGERREG